jgi:hypothetical protein
MRRAIQPLAMSMMLIALTGGFLGSRVNAQQANTPQTNTPQTKGHPDPAAMSALKHKYLTWGQVHNVKLHSQSHGWQKSHEWKKGPHTGWLKDHPWRRGGSHFGWRAHHWKKGAHFGWLHAHHGRHEHRLGWKLGRKANGAGAGREPARHHNEPVRHHHGREHR